MSQGIIIYMSYHVILRRVATVSILRLVLVTLSDVDVVTLLNTCHIDCFSFRNKKLLVIY